MDNYQSLSSKQGFDFENDCIKSLNYAGFTVNEKHTKLPGVEIDLVATNTKYISFFIDCKGSVRGDRAGIKRTDTLRKAIAEAYLMHRSANYPVLLMASPIPLNGTGKEILLLIERSLIFDIINPYTDGKRLRWLANASEDELDKEMCNGKTLWRVLSDRMGYSEVTQKKWNLR